MFVNETPLYRSIYDNGNYIYNNTTNLKKLLENGANPNNWKDPTKIPLHLACISRNIQFIDLLLEYGADIEANNENKIYSVLIL